MNAAAARTAVLRRLTVVVGILLGLAVARLIDTRVTGLSFPEIAGVLIVVTALVATSSRRLLRRVGEPAAAQR